MCRVDFVVQLMDKRWDNPGTVLQIRTSLMCTRCVQEKKQKTGADNRRGCHYVRVYTNIQVHGKGKTENDEPYGLSSCFSPCLPFLLPGLRSSPPLLVTSNSKRCVCTVHQCILHPRPSSCWWVRSWPTFVLISDPHPMFVTVHPGSALRYP